MPGEHSYKALCREFDVDPSTAWGAVCQQFHIRGGAEAAARIAELEAEVEALRLPANYSGGTFSAWGTPVLCTVRLRFTDAEQAEAWFERITDRAEMKERS